jgi:hypothetical protein
LAILSKNVSVFWLKGEKVKRNAQYEKNTKIVLKKEPMDVEKAVGKFLNTVRRVQYWQF